MKDENRKIAEFASKLIERFREEFAENPRIKTGKINFPEEFSYPCQIAILWMKREENHDYQIVLKTKNPKCNDKEIIVYGPYSIDDEEDARCIEKLLEKDFFKFVEHIDHIEKYRRSVENLITLGYKGAKKIQKKNSMQGSLIEQKDYLILYYCRLDQMKIEDILERLRKDISVEIPYFGPPKYLDFFGGFIRPSVWFGDIPKIDYRTKLKGSRLIEHIGEPLHFKFKDKKLMLKKDGSIAISLRIWQEDKPVPEEYPFSEEGYDDIRSAKSNLNEIFGMLILKGFSIYTVDSDNFGWKTLVLGSDFVSESYKPNSFGEKMYNERHALLSLDEFKKHRQIIPVNTFEEIIEVLNFINENDKKQETKLIPLIETLAHSFTNISEGNDAESLKLSWVIIEQFVNFLCKVNKIKTEKNNAESKIKALESSEIIDESISKLMNKIRFLRNKSLHELRKIKNKEANEALILSRNLLSFRIASFLKEHFFE